MFLPWNAAQQQLLFCPYPFHESGTPCTCLQANWGNTTTKQASPAGGELQLPVPRPAFPQKLLAPWGQRDGAVRLSVCCALGRGRRLRLRFGAAGSAPAGRLLRLPQLLICFQRRLGWSCQPQAGLCPCCLWRRTAGMLELRAPGWQPRQEVQAALPARADISCRAAVAPDTAQKLQIRASPQGQALCKALSSPVRPAQVLRVPRVWGTAWSTTPAGASHPRFCHQR